jgi:hypothetical protein
MGAGLQLFSNNTTLKISGGGTVNLNAIGANSSVLSTGSTEYAIVTVFNASSTLYVSAIGSGYVLNAAATHYVGPSTTLLNSSQLGGFSYVKFTNSP